ncbi:hypothetical protein CHLNCDRAFT_133696 [Chlorella variabilis]|uniref:Bifunctional inhibitor/plant lipid transfer protein/seed storage helical domain-containing protein n=1 Tax=Chlorella variabilis TaxID=554065 RepID=E1Z3L4_CHLVA|nr:hypothetical protein CHLNCDRAFT_133696 [Chlorella variabilis]EFN60183.1 hypothetical protein CHLNCDRAFT_133696 [Chlorella variabilis]|eukprot:XP_005852285.1 hypothetical protein CHLNCDRAFT_133696 [Chlorella variabilis]
MLRLLQRPLGPLLLLAAALAAAGAVRPAAAARGLAQAAESAAAAAPQPPPAAEAPAQQPPESMYGSAEVDACIRVTNSAGQACTVESDTLSLVFPRGSEELPTPEQVQTAINNMKAAAQPSRTCCQELRPFADGRCPCDAGYQQLLPIGGFDPAYFEGATAILAQACGFDFPPCQPGEVIDVAAVNAGTGAGG